MKKKILSVLIAVSMAASLAACSTGDDSAGSGQSGKSDNASEDSEITVQTAYEQLRVATDAKLKSLEPDAVDPDLYMIYDLYEPLFDYSEDDDTLIPCLASGYKAVSERQWQVTLHDDIYDWEGNNLTAEDVAWCFEKVLEQPDVSGYDSFDSVEVTGTYTFTVYWTEDVDDPAMVKTPMTRTLIYTEKAYEEKGNFKTEPVGTGCYLVTAFEPGERLTLDVNENYWALNYLDSMDDRHRAKVQEIIFSAQEPAEAVEGLKEGTIDICGSLSIDEADELKTGEYADQYRQTALVNDGYWYLGANTKNVGKDLRRALYYSLDSDEIARAMGGNYFALHAFATERQTDWDDDLILDDTYAAGQDEAKASEYLESTEYSGSTLDLVCPNSAEAVQAARQIQDQAAKSGINIEITAVTNERFALTVNTEETRNWDLALGYVEGASVLDAWKQLFQDNGGGNILYLINDSDFKEMGENLTGEDAPTEEQMKEYEEYITENAYLYPVAAKEQIIVYTSEIQSVEYQNGYYYLRD